MTYFEQQIQYLMNKHMLTRTDAVNMLKEINARNSTLTVLDTKRQQAFHSRLDMYNNYFR